MASRNGLFIKKTVGLVCGRSYGAPRADVPRGRRRPGWTSRQVAYNRREARTIGRDLTGVAHEQTEN
jgi:hypothetical protein